MKVGDLVELSSYGKRLKMMKKYIGDLGVINEIKVLGMGVPDTNSYQIIWAKAGKTIRNALFERRDLKYAKTRY